MLPRTTAAGVTCLRKTTSYDARTEAAGLAALGAAGAHVPDVLSVTARELVIEEVHGDGDWAACGERLAAVHETVGPGFGWHVDGWIGPLPLRNTWSDAWPTFYSEHRLAPWLDDLDDELARRLRAAVDDGRLARLLDHDVAPSLVHGDLWAGNVVGGQWLVDPAVHHADRELDLAMARLFGGFPEVFFAAYEDVRPLDAGWRERLPALQLFHLLVHVRLFDGGYQRQVAERLDELGW